MIVEVLIASWRALRPAGPISAMISRGADSDAGDVIQLLYSGGQGVISSAVAVLLCGSSRRRSGRWRYLPGLAMRRIAERAEEVTGAMSVHLATRLQAYLAFPVQACQPIDLSTLEIKRISRIRLSTT
jgi:hypothetical protein